MVGGFRSIFSSIYEYIFPKKVVVADTHVTCIFEPRYNLRTRKPVDYVEKKVDDDDDDDEDLNKAVEVLT